MYPRPRQRPHGCHPYPAAVEYGTGISLAVYSHREIYNTYHALLTTPRYLDQPSKAAAATAASCKVAKSTVYQALRSMERQSTT